MELSGSVTEARRSFALTELANNFNEIKAQMEQGGGEIGDDLIELHEIAKSLLSGKLDAVGKAKDALVAHTQACEMQIEYNNKMISQIDKMVKEAVEATPEKKINGMVYSAKETNNPPSVMILNEEEIPLEYKNFTVTISEKFQASNIAALAKYRDFILQRTVTTEAPMTDVEQEYLSKYIDLSVDKKKISADLKESKTISGASLNRTTRIDFKAGKVKNKLLE